MDRHADTQSRIVAVARDLFHARSYEHVGVKEICEAAQVQKGSFYHFFPSKRDLALAVIEDFAEDWSRGLLAEAFDPAVPALERFDRLVEAVYRWHKAQQALAGRMSGCPFGNLALEISTREEGLRDRIGLVFDRALERFRGALVEAVRDGALENVDTEATAEAMLGYLEGIILLAKTRNDPEVLRRLGPAIKTLRVEAK